MPERFDPWVHVVCGGAWGLAAYLLYDPDHWWLVVLPAGLAVGFTLWPDRIAFAYRLGRGRPRWSSGTSVVNPGALAPSEDAARFADYRPRLQHLFNGYVSITPYVLLAIRWGDAPEAGWIAIVSIVAGGAILWNAARHESATNVTRPF